MAAEISKLDELSDDLAALRPLIVLAARGELTPQQAEALPLRYDAIGTKANGIATFARLARVLETRGDTPHTRSLVRQIMRIELPDKVPA
jgi:hypothetical protein